MMKDQRRNGLIDTLKAAGGVHNAHINAPHIADAILAHIQTWEPDPPHLDTLAFVRDWLANSDYDPTQFDKDFAAAIDARTTRLSQWPNIGPDPMKGSRTGNRGDQAAAAVRAAYSKQQTGVPDQTALVWRWHLGPLLEAHVRLGSILGMSFNRVREPVDAVRLGVLIDQATDSELSDGGRYFRETCDDLTRCRHGDTGEYQHSADGELVEYLWNNRRALAAAASLVPDMEQLLAAIRAEGDWTNEVEAICKRWRAAQGSAGKGPWQWWWSLQGEESYRDAHDTREAALAEARKAEPGETYHLVQARLWNDAIGEGEEVMPFAETRNEETVEPDPFICRAKELLREQLSRHSDEGVQALNGLAAIPNSNPAVLALAEELRAAAERKMGE